MQKKRNSGQKTKMFLLYTLFPLLYRKDKSLVYERYTKAFIQKDKLLDNQYQLFILNRHSAVTQFR